MGKYFTEKTIEFFIEIGLNNYKSWFLEHKSDYEINVLEPFKYLVSQLEDTMKIIDSDFITEPKVDKTISRIYKDTRFSKEKLPFRNNAWITFKVKSENWKSRPCFYFEITPEIYRYGMGFYNTDTKTIELLRKLIVKNQFEFENIINEIKKQNIFKLEGENYKRLENPDLSESLWEYYMKKSFYYSSNHIIDDFLFSGELSKKLQKDFMILKPIYDYLKINL